MKNFNSNINKKHMLNYKTNTVVLKYNLIYEL